MDLSSERNKRALAFHLELKPGRSVPILYDSTDYRTSVSALGWVLRD